MYRSCSNWFCVMADTLRKLKFSRDIGSGLLSHETSRSELPPASRRPLSYLFLVAASSLRANQIHCPLPSPPPSSRTGRDSIVLLAASIGFARLVDRSHERTYGIRCIRQAACTRVGIIFAGRRAKLRERERRRSPCHGGRLSRRGSPRARSK